MTSSGFRPMTLKKEEVMTYQSFNPATGKLLKKFEELTDKQLETKIAAAATCFETWRHKTYAEQRSWLQRQTNSRTR